MIGLMDRRRAVVIVALGGLLATLALTSTANAATYYACIKKKGGAIRLVSKRTRCRRNEYEISFNGQGISGKNGKNGTNGTNGFNGTNGLNGKDGATGFTSTLPPGATEEGTWGQVVPKESLLYSAVSFNIPLTAAPHGHIIEEKGPSTAECPGTAADPTATSGQLCIYVAQATKESVFLFNPNGPGGSPGVAGPYGAIVGVFNEAPVAEGAFGTWAVTG